MCSADSQAYLLDTAHSAVLRSDGCGWDTILSPERPTEHQELEQHKKYRPHAATANMTLSSAVSTRASKITHTQTQTHSQKTWLSGRKNGEIWMRHRRWVREEWQKPEEAEERKRRWGEWCLQAIRAEVQTACFNSCAAQLMLILCWRNRR